jgi:hypothetical protein
LVVWQASHCTVVTKWPDVLPVAVVPLWQVVHEPETEPWSKLIDVQLLVVWQASQVLVLAMCPEGFPFALVPLWHE